MLIDFKSGLFEKIIINVIIKPLHFAITGLQLELKFLLGNNKALALSRQTLKNEVPSFQNLNDV